MDLTHLHLLLNHFPTICSIVGLGLLLFAMVGKNDELKRASLVVFVGIALLSIPTYVSGNAAQEKICVAKPDEPCADPAISKSLIETHEGAALSAFVFIELTGALAWLGLWQFRRRSRPSTATLAAVLVLALATFGLVARAANIGGEIHHPEIRAGQETVTFEGHLGRTVGSAIMSFQWGWASLETLHFIGLSLLMGVVTLIDLRMLGVIKNVSFASLHRLLPWAILGFGTNVISGMLFFAASPYQYTGNRAFHWKLVLVMLAGANALYFTFFDEAWAVGPGDKAPRTAQIFACSAVLLWICVMYFGSMLPFIGNSF